MSLEILLLAIAFVVVTLLLAWRWFTQRIAQAKQVLESSAGTIQQAKEAKSYLHNGLGTLPFPTVKEKIDRKLEKVETEYTDLTQKLHDLRKPFESRHEPFLKSGWSRLNYQWQRYHKAATLWAPTQDLKQQIPILRDLIKKPKYLVAYQGRELLHFTIQPSLKTAQELVGEGMQGEALASDARHLEELKSRLNQEDFPFRLGPRVEEASWESTKHAWQTLEAMETPVHKLSEEIQYWKGKCREIKPKLGELDRKLDILRTCLDQVPAFISDLPPDRQLRHKAQQLREVCNLPRVEDLDQRAIEIQQLIDRVDNQIRQVEDVTADYYHLGANIKTISNLLSQIDHERGELQTAGGYSRLYLESRVEWEHINDELKTRIGPITTKRTIDELKDHLSLSEKLKKQAEALAERCEVFLEDLS